MLQSILKESTAALARLYAGRTGGSLKDFEAAIRAEKVHDSAWAKRVNLVHAVLDPEQPQVF